MLARKQGNMLKMGTCKSLSNPRLNLFKVRYAPGLDVFRFVTRNQSDCFGVPVEMLGPSEVGPHVGEYAGGG